MKHALISLREELRALQAQYGALATGPVTEETVRLRDQTARETAQVRDAIALIDATLLAQARAA